jgi:hypothetical protein
MDNSMANAQVNQQTQIQTQIQTQVNPNTQIQRQTQSQNLYTVLADLQSNHRRYLQVIDDALEIIREQRQVRGGFRSSLSGYRESITATAPTTVPNDTLSFEFVSVMDPASILAMLRDASGSGLGQLTGGGSTSSNRDISNNTTVYQQPELPEPATCPITLEPIEAGTNVMKITRCGHVFKEAPLRRWLQRDGRCPVCRGNLT